MQSFVTSLHLAEQTFGGGGAGPEVYSVEFKGMYHGLDVGPRRPSTMRARLRYVSSDGQVRDLMVGMDTMCEHTIFEPWHVSWMVFLRWTLRRTVAS